MKVLRDLVGKYLGQSTNDLVGKVFGEYVCESVRVEYLGESTKGFGRESTRVKC